MSTDAPSSEERRRHPRRVVNLRAHAKVPGAPAADACIVKDISESGAFVLFPSRSEAPTGHFLLFLDRQETVRRACKVVRAAGSGVGVQFCDVSVLREAAEAAARTGRAARTRPAQPRTAPEVSFEIE